MASEQMDDMLTVREVVRLLHVHPNTLRRWSNKGRITAYHISPRGDMRFKCKEIARFLAKLNTQASREKPRTDNIRIVVTVVNESSTNRAKPDTRPKPLTKSFRLRGDIDLSSYST